MVTATVGLINMNLKWLIVAFWERTTCGYWIHLVQLK
jgi:hypothetical protein